MTNSNGSLPMGRHKSLYPMHKLKRVDKPTTLITDAVQRPDPRQNGFARAARGEYGPAPQREMGRFVGKYPLSASFARMTMSMGPLLAGETAAQKAPIPLDPALLSQHIKSLGYFLRADVVGICRLPQYAVYSHDMKGNPIELDHQYAIVLVIDQDYDTMSGSTGDDWISSSQSFIGYANAAQISCVMADYIRRLGYPARAHNAAEYQVVVPPLLLLAGIGEMSRAGIVLNPFLGMRFKAAVVTTDLPLLPDKPVDFGLQKFCEKCLKCAEQCHSRAITSGGKVMHNGYETWRFDAAQCSKFRLGNPYGSACGRCIKVCPYNKPPGILHDAVRWTIHRLPFLDALTAKADDLLGYGKPDKKHKWWFDLEDANGALRVPENKRTD